MTRKAASYNTFRSVRLLPAAFETPEVNVASG